MQRLGDEEVGPLIFCKIRTALVTASPRVRMLKVDAPT